MISHRHFRLAVAITLGSAAFTASTAAAQRPLLSPGSRVRVTAPDDDIRSVTGHVVQMTSDSMTIDRDGARGNLTLPIDRLSRLDVSTGKSPSHGFFRGAGLGLIIGAVVGVAFGALEYLSSNKEERELVFFLTTPVGAAAGIVVGGIAGAVDPPDLWQRVPLPPPPSGSRRLGAGRVTRVGFRIAF